MRVEDVGTQGKGNVLCCVSCFWCMRPLKHWQILAKRPGLATVAPPIICWIVAPLGWWCLGTRRSNNCVYLPELLLPWLYLEFVQPSLDGPTSPLMAARIPGPHLLFMSDSYRWSLSALSYSTSVHISHKVRSSELGLKTYLSDLHYCPPGCGCALSLHVRNLSKQKYFVKILAAHFPAQRKYN